MFNFHSIPDYLKLSILHYVKEPFIVNMLKSNMIISLIQKYDLLILIGYIILDSY